MMTRKSLKAALHLRGAFQSISNMPGQTMCHAGRNACSEIAMADQQQHRLARRRTLLLPACTAEAQQHQRISSMLSIGLACTSAAQHTSACAPRLQHSCAIIRLLQLNNHNFAVSRCRCKLLLVKMTSDGKSATENRRDSHSMPAAL